MTLSESQSRALAAICADPLVLSSDWESAGHRRQLFFFTNAAREVRVRISDVVVLAAHGLAELADDPKDPEALWAHCTSRGAALMKQSA